MSHPVALYVCKATLLYRLCAPVSSLSLLSPPVNSPNIRIQIELASFVHSSSTESHHKTWQLMNNKSLNRVFAFKLVSLLSVDSEARPCRVVYQLSQNPNWASGVITAAKDNKKKKDKQIITRHKVCTAWNHLLFETIFPFHYQRLLKVSLFLVPKGISIRWIPT